MTTTGQTVRSYRRVCRIHPHCSGMVMGMAIKIGAMTGLTVRPIHLTTSTAEQGPGCGTVAGLATQSGMGLTCGNIRGSSRCSMTIDAQGDCGHAVGMGMAIEIHAMAGLTVCT